VPEDVIVARHMSTQTLRNWLKASEAGKLNGPGAKVVTAEQMELSRLRAENKRLQMELKSQKKRRRSSRRTSCEVRLD
jgi:transposase